jgi:hypothetical protein
MLLPGLVLGDRVLKSIKRRGPKFHAIEVYPQSFQGFDQIAYDRIRWRFWHRNAPVYVTRRFLLFCS